jgi:hypothetical protein
MPSQEGHFSFRALPAGIVFELHRTRTDGLQDLYSRHGFLSWEGFSGKIGTTLPTKVRSFWDTVVLLIFYD